MKCHVAYSNDCILYVLALQQKDYTQRTTFIIAQPILLLPRVLMGYLQHVHLILRGKQIQWDSLQSLRM